MRGLLDLYNPPQNAQSETHAINGTLHPLILLLLLVVHDIRASLALSHALADGLL